VAKLSDVTTSLLGRRLLLRPLRAEDYWSWQEVRRRNADWLNKWEPRRPAGAPDPAADRSAFALRCHARDREWQSGVGYGFGVFVGGVFCGEINLNSVQRGPFQSAYLGYWIDEEQAGNGYTPEGVVMVLRFGFEELKLHRVQISIVPRNQASLRVVEKVELRNEGIAERYLEINGVWEDHVRYAITSEEWLARKDELVALWL